MTERDDLQGDEMELPITLSKRKEKEVLSMKSKYTEEADKFRTAPFRGSDEQTQTMTKRKRVIPRDREPFEPEGFNPGILSHITDDTRNAQVYCPLFSKLPAEIRQIIYKFVFLQYEAKSRLYRSDSQYYRPGSTCRKFIDTALLYTCRRVLIEARFIPLQTATHEFWCDTYPPDHAFMYCKMKGTCTSRGLNHWHAPYMRHIHVNISTMSYFFRRGPFCQNLEYESSPKFFHPRSLTFFIGYTDWLFWQFGQAPQLKYLNFFNYSLPEEVEEFSLCLETLEVFAKNLDNIVKVLMEEKIPLNHGPNSSPTRHLSAEGISPKVSRWTGPHSFYLKKEWTYNIQHLGSDPMALTEMRYYVVEMKWRVRRIEGT